MSMKKIMQEWLKMKQQTLDHFERIFSLNCKTRGRRCRGWEEGGRTHRRT